MDVVEIDPEVTDIAKEYFFLDKLYKDYDLENNDRLNLITADGRIYLNENNKKYDAILNDAFSGNSPAITLTTVEASQRIHDSLNENGVYLTNVISSISGKDSRFLKSIVATLHTTFKNVYVIPCRTKDNVLEVQNNMVVATDDTLDFSDIEVTLSDPKGAMILTDNHAPVDTLIPFI